MKSKFTFLICILLVIIPLGVHAEVLTYAEAQEAIRQSIQAWYMRGSNRQYNSSKNTYSELRHPEEFTPQDIGYSVCSGFTNDAWMEAFGYKSGSDGIGGRTPAGSTNYCVEARQYLDEKGCTTSTLKYGCKGEFLVFYSNKDGTSYYYNPSKLSESNIKKFSNFVKLLEPGDIVSYDGHVTIVYDLKYDSNGNKIDALLFESIGGGYFTKTKIDTDEAVLHKLFYYKSKKTDKNNLLDINTAYMPYEGTVHWKWLSKYTVFVKDEKEMTCKKGMCSITRPFYKGTDGNAVFNYDVVWPQQIKTSKARIEMPGIYIQKTSSKYDNNSVILGDTITYTIRLINNSNLSTIKRKNQAKKYTSIHVIENLPNEVEFVASSVDDSLQGTYNSSNNTIKWDVATIPVGGTVIIKYKVKVKNNAKNLGNFIETTGKVYKSKEDNYITTGVVRHEIINTTSVTDKKYEDCYKEAKNNNAKSLDLIQKTYECAYKGTDLEFDFKVFSKTGDNMLDSMFVYPATKLDKMTARVRLNTSGKRKIYTDMILNSYWNGLAKDDRGVGKSVFFLPRWRYNNSGIYIDDNNRAKTINSGHFKTGDVLIYYIDKNSTKEKLRFTNEDGLYAFIYINGSFVGVNYSGTTKERNEFTSEYYDKNKLDKATNLYNGSSSYYEYANYQSILGKDEYLILRPEKVITEVSKIKVKTMPTKTSYYQKQTLNTSGGVITATYNDGTSEDISMNDSSVKITGFNSSIVGEQDVTVTYKGKSTSFKVTIMENDVSSISIKTNPSKVNYYVGDSLSLARGVITVHYADGSTKNISMSNSAVTVSGFNSETAGTKTITVKYANKTTTFTVQVNAVVLSTVVIDKYPSKLDYETGQDLDLTGGKIKLIYNNGTVQTLDMSDSQITVSGYDKTSAGLQEISLSIMGMIVTFDVIVNPKTTYPSVTILLKDISIYSTPSKLNYYIGEELDLTGGKVKVYYDYNYGEEVISKYFIEEMKSGNVSGFSSDTAGTKTITVNYSGHTATFDVVVSERVRTIKKISINKLPRKRNYIQYQEDLSVDEGSITITYTDDSTEVVPLTEEDVTLLDFDNSKLGEQQVVVVYKGLETSFPVTVYESGEEIEDIDDDDGNIQSVEIAQGADNTRYIVGESFDVSGIILRVLYEDGATRNVELSDYPGLYTISGFDNTKVGEQLVTIYYDGYGVQLKVEVIPGSITIPAPDTLSTKSLITIIFGLLLFGVGGTIIFINTKKEA